MAKVLPQMFGAGGLVLPTTLLVLACAATAPSSAPPLPCPATSAGATPPQAATSAPPVEPVDCTKDEQCQTRGGECIVSARCVASHCQMQLKPPRTRCTLSGLQQGYQNVYISERGEAGICREGACVPRMQCAELCSVELGPPLWKKLKAALDACQKQQPNSGNLCSDDLSASPEMQAEAKRVTDRCLVDCGFPDLDAMP
jgi:hypothetical protein